MSHNLVRIDNPESSSRSLNGCVGARRPQLNDERGYTLIALIALMSLLALFALAAAPRVQQQAQREREKEAIFRGEQVADAIRSYYNWNIRYRGTQGTVLRIAARRRPAHRGIEMQYATPRRPNFYLFG